MLFLRPSPARKENPLGFEALSCYFILFVACTQIVVFIGTDSCHKRKESGMFWSFSRSFATGLLKWRNPMLSEKYAPLELEKKWQQTWEEGGLFKVREDQARPKYYVLEMFPYPSGKIHMGHVRNYTIGDVVARYKRMRGFNVLHPMGWDAFGMPAENAAIQNRTHPAVWTYDNIEAMRNELKRLGFSYDWDREIATCKPEYYRWEQWLFIQMFKKNMVYLKEAYVNWCETCQTVLANEQVDDGACWRCGKQVRQEKKWQWYFRITDFAEDLLEHCDHLPGWPEKVITMQRNWIGKSVGARIRFAVEGRQEWIDVFTTRPDTICGASFLCLAPEHPLVLELSRCTNQGTDVDAFIEKMAHQERTARAMETVEKEGVFIGAFVINPVSGAKLPIYAGNFVLMEYGTGAVMGVPAHDQRDFEFAERYGLSRIVVVQPKGAPLNVADMKEAWVGPGTLVNSGTFTGMDNVAAQSAIAEWLAEKKLGEKDIRFRLRDWGISRQRYWGTPIPMIHCNACGVVPVPEKDLPVVLPEDVTLPEKGGSPLATLPLFYEVTCPTCGQKARRDTDTMDTFVESSWYFLRFCSPHMTEGMFDREAARYWMAVDQYIGGVEHAVMHLLYARYFTRVLEAEGLVDVKEPFTNLLTQGMVCKETTSCPEHGFLYPEEVLWENGNPVCSKCNKAVTVGRVEKMSKSKRNTVDPGALLDRYGADTTRLFCLFAAPPERDLEWSDTGVEGASRFLHRVWRLARRYLEPARNAKPYDGAMSDLDEGHREIFRKTHQSLKKVSEDIERFHFNTAISTVMELVNLVFSAGEKGWEIQDAGVARHLLDSVCLMLSPIVPHITEEIWQALDAEKPLLETPWPTFREDALASETVLIVVQVNGKLRDRLSLPVDMPEEDVKTAALASEGAVRFLEGKTVKKIILVPGKLVNIVVA